MEINTSIEPVVLENQYILTQVGTRRIAFPAESVAGILLVERARVLSLPFYHEVILGIVHHQGQLVTLITFQQLLEGTPSYSREVFNAIQLGKESGAPGLGLVVDRLLGNCGEDQISANSDIEKFQPHLLKPELWQPQRWASPTT